MPSRPALPIVLLVGMGLACASGPPPPQPVRPVGKDALLAWTIERGLYDGGLKRSTEVVTIRTRDGRGNVEVLDFGVVEHGNAKPQTPVTYKRGMTPEELAGLNRALFALELPDAGRRSVAPAIVPWTLWGICFPTTRAMQCGQLLDDEWRDVQGASDLFALLGALRQESIDRPDR